MKIFIQFVRVIGCFEMNNFLMRLDDASEKRDVSRWNRIENLLDFYSIKPLVGVIPNCEDPEMDKYSVDDLFWHKVKEWEDKEWKIAMHGYNHVYCTSSGGKNPINKKSEFAGLSLEDQRKKIKAGVAVFRKHGIEPKIFFAPAHTFDENTVEALKIESNISVISDTIANDVYYENGITYVPQQSGKVRLLPFKVVTFCYHPNTMDNKCFEELEAFIQKNESKFVSFPTAVSHREKNIVDFIVEQIYFFRRKIQ